MIDTFPACRWVLIACCYISWAGLTHSDTLLCSCSYMYNVAGNAVYFRWPKKSSVLDILSQCHLFFHTIEYKFSVPLATEYVQATKTGTHVYWCCAKKAACCKNDVLFHTLLYETSLPASTVISTQRAWCAFTVPMLHHFKHRTGYFRSNLAWSDTT